MMLMEEKFDYSTKATKRVAVPADTYQQLSQFLYREARLLDTRQWDAWLKLWTPDGMYWIPRSRDQQSPYDALSLCWDDDVLRRVRMRILDSPRRWSQQPRSSASRLIGNISVDGTDTEGCLLVHSVVHMTEWRRETMFHRAGSCVHKLVADGDSWKIKLKRVDLIDCDGAYEAIELYM